MRAKNSEWKYDGRDANNFFFAAPGENIKLIVYGILVKKNCLFYVVSFFFFFLQFFVFCI